VSLSKQSAGRKMSNVGGWQSNDLTGEHKPLDLLFSEIMTYSSIFSKDIGLKNSLHMNNIWVNINGYKDNNKSHIHSDCVLSGVYYCQAPINSGALQFPHPLNELLEYEWKHNVVSNYNNYTSQLMSVTPKNNLLLLFPGWLRHYVDPNLNKKNKRISLSFNISVR
jgi:uncharacterized protein (TIGR02466 family)